MTDTYADISCTTSAWVDVYAARSIVAQTELLIQNKSNYAMYLQVKATQPSASSTDGFLLKSGESVVSKGTATSSLWVLGNGKISVQEY